MIELECKRVLFHSPQDEAAFFAWAQGIPAVASVTGRGDCIILCVKSKRISIGSLRELLGLFFRYHVSMKQLAQFRNSKNEGWFVSPDAYWFELVFSGKPNDVVQRTQR